MGRFGTATKLEMRKIDRNRTDRHRIDRGGSRERGARCGFSSQCRAGNVKVLRGSWNEELFRVLEGFPDLAHDDEVDACSGVLEMLNPQMKGWNVFELYRRQAEELRAERDAQDGDEDEAT